MMDAQLIKQLADYVHHAEKEKREIKRITAEIYPDLTIEEAYLVQDELVKQKLAEGKNIIGLKMGLTSEAKMKQMQVNNPLYGYVFDYMAINDGETISMSDYIHPKAEPEIGFILNKDLEGPDVTLLDVLRATEHVFPAIEIIDSRYENFEFTLPDVIADNTSASGVVLGASLRRPETLELDVVGVTLSINGDIKALGAGANVLGHPANSIVRLVHMLSQVGKKVKAGDMILTGGITAAIPIKAGDHVVAKMGGLGEVSFLVKE